MVTDELRSYIQSQLTKNTPIDLIRARLLSAGWESADVDSAFEELTPKENISAPIAKIALDPYRELPTETMANGQVVKLATPIASVAPAEPKVWVPMQVKPKEINQVVEPQAIEISEHSIAPETMAESSSASSTNIKNVESLSDIEFDEPVETISKINQVKTPETIATESMQYSPIMGTIVPQVASGSPSPLMPYGEKTNTPVVNISSPSDQVISSNPKVSEVPEVQTISKQALISTYATDISSANKANPDALVVHKSNFIKLGIILLIILALGGVVYAFMIGLIKLPNLGVIKKDPKTLLANNALALLSHSAYKADTTITLSTPAVANITSGLMNGQSITSHDTDSITIVMHKQVTNSPTAHLSDIPFTVSSSLLKNNIDSDIKYDGATTYIDVPDLSEILGKDAPVPSAVAVGSGEWGLISHELPANIQDVIKRIDVYDIASKGVPPFVLSELSSLFDGFIKNISVTDKGSEVVDNVDTYHYTLNPDHQATKQFLNGVLSLFITTLSPEMKTNLDNALGAVQFKTFDVWVGKSDNLIHKYSVVLSAPLSKVIALDDKGIAGNVVKFSIETTYRDFDVPNEITLPAEAVKAADYAKIMHDTKIKNLLSSIFENAKVLSHADGGYGKVSNTIGSCLSPKSGSLFSPLGHAKGATAPVGAIADTLNTMLDLSGSVGSCFSTPTAWAIAVPASADPSISYCTDSTSNGSIISLSSTLAGPVCK